jgi:hypothetical protein
LIQQLELVCQIAVSSPSLTGFKFLTPLPLRISAAEELVLYFSDELELKTFIMLYFISLVHLPHACLTV